MPVALTGGLIGLALGLLLFGVEYVVLRSAMAGRARRMHQRAVFDPTERHRISKLARFAICLPPAFATIAWYLWS
jgi:hypothetical protein